MFKKNKINITKILDVSILFLTFLTFIFMSGYPLFNLEAYRYFFNIWLIIITGILLIKYFLFFNIEIFNKKNASYSIKKTLFVIFSDISNFFLILFSLSVIVVFAINISLTQNAFNSITSTLCLILFAFLSYKCFSAKRLLKIFMNIFPMICLFSLTIFLPSLFFNFSPNFYSVTSNYGTYNNFFFIIFQLQSVFNRNCGIFWEPALFGIFLVFAIVLEFLNGKPNYIKIVIYLISIVTTFSASAYLCLFVILIYLASKLSSHKGKLIKTLLFLMPLLLPFAIFVAYPNVIHKFFDFNVSLQSRLFGPFVNLKIFFDHPFGVGQINESDIFFEYVASMNFDIDAQVSTFGYWLSTYGIFGLPIIVIPFVGIFAIKKETIFQKIILCILFITFLSVEPLQNNACLYFVVFCLLENLFKSKRDAIINEYGYSNIYLKFNSNEKTKQFIQNSFGTYLIKGFALFLGLFTTPAYIKYFDNELVLGVWFTILSLISWILTFDLGIGNGLKNKLIDAFAKKDNKRASSYIVSAYVSTFFLVLIIFIIGLIAAFILDFNKIFNISTTIITSVQLRNVVIIIFVSICLNFILKLIGNIYESFQIQAVTNSFSLFTNLFLFFFVIIFNTEQLYDKLLALALVYLIANNLPLIIATIVAFLTKLKKIDISFKNFSVSSSKEVAMLGGIFFIIQICLLFINSSNEIILTQLFGPTSVNSYTYYNKIFTIVITFATLLSGPLWSIIAKASSSKDINWIKKVNSIIFKFDVCLITVDLLIMLCLPIIFKIWLGENAISVNWVASIVFFIHDAILIIAYLSSAISNGIGNLKPQMYAYLIGVLIKIASIVLLFNIDIGKEYWYIVRFTSAIALLPVAIVLPITNNRFLRRKIK